MGMLEWGNRPNKVPIDTENAASKTNIDFLTLPLL